MLLNEMMDESSSKEKIENDIEIQKNQLYILTEQLGLDPYKNQQTIGERPLTEVLLKKKRAAGEVDTATERRSDVVYRALCSPLLYPYWQYSEYHRAGRTKRTYYKSSGSKSSSFGPVQYQQPVQTIDMVKLQKKKESLTATKEVIMKAVQLLWDRLQWPQEKQEQFTKMTSLCSICEATNMWGKELQTLEELKKEKLKEITLKVRQELESYWQKCFYTDEQKAAFQLFYDENFSEELLNYHDEELFKIKVLYEEAKCVYDSIHKWEAILDRFIELQKKSTDPSRILNRGRNLLKDESECSKIQKQLLELGEELKKKIENWEKEHNSDFLIRSQRFLDSMAHQLQQYKLKKDQPKTSVKWDESATPKEAMKRSAHVNTATPNKIRKVKYFLNA